MKISDKIAYNVIEIQIRMLLKNKNTNIGLKDRVFIAGHNGLVGSAIYRSLKANGYKNLLTIGRDKLDLRNQQNVEEWFKKFKPSHVILAAGKVGGINANNTYPSDFLLDNLNIQNNVISSTYKYCSGRLLFLGSCCIYPKYTPNPIKESSLLTGELEPTNECYAIAKIAGLKLCSALKKQHGFDTISVMPANLYGPGDNYHLENSHVIPALIRKFTFAKEHKESFVKCWGSGNARREFLHVNDLAEACLHLLKHWNPSTSDFNHINVGTSEEISIKELAELIARLVEFEGEIIWDKTMPDGTPRRVLDTEMITATGWKPTIKLEDGLKETINNFRNLKNNFRK